MENRKTINFNNMETEKFTIRELIDEKKRLKRMIIDINKEILYLIKENKYKINKKEKRVANLRIIQEYTLSEIAKKLCLTPERIRQIEWKAIMKMDRPDFNIIYKRTDS